MRRSRTASARAWRWPSAFALALLLHLGLLGGGLGNRGDGAQNSAGPDWGAGEDAVSVYELHFSEPAIAADAAVPSAAQTSPQAAAPADARSSVRDAGGGGRDGYYASLRAHLQRYRRPIQASTTGPRTVVVRFRVGADGDVSAIGLQRGSGDALLDAEALDLVRRAAPVPPPPRRQAKNLTVPIEFE